MCITGLEFSEAGAEIWTPQVPVGMTEQHDTSQSAHCYGIRIVSLWRNQIWMFHSIERWGCERSREAELASPSAAPRLKRAPWALNLQAPD